MANSTRIPHLPICVNENDINNGAIEILKHIRPFWPIDDIQFKLLTDGITNKLIGCKLKNKPEEETVLVRIYGNKTDLLIDRKAETRNIILLNNVGLAPHLYATFENGLAYEFVPGCTLSSDTIIIPKIYHLVAEKMAQLHKVKATNGINEQAPFLWKKLQSFLDLVPDVFSDPEKQKKFEERVIPKHRIQEEVNFMKQKLMNTKNPVVFSHNDLLLGNIIYTESKNCVTFIDYEYAAFNYQAFDIGNHFAEFVGIDNIDFSKYPNKDLQLDWLKVYLSIFKNTQNISDEEVFNLYVEVNQFALVAHLFWGIWCLIQTEHSYINFDFLSYASIKFNEYMEKKPIFLALESTR